MRLGFRVSVTLVVSLTVLLSAALVLLYGIPTAQGRLLKYTRSYTLAQAAATADAITGADQKQWRSIFGGSHQRATQRTGRNRDPLRRSLSLYAGPTGARILVVNRKGEVVAREGSRAFSAPHKLLRQAASGKRSFEQSGKFNVAVVPILNKGKLAGGVVFAAEDPENAVYRIYLRSGFEAVLIALVISGGIALLLATVLGRRVERLTLGARSIAQGDLSYRIVPDYNDELGELARTFNSMAGKLEDSFSRLREKSAALNAILDNLNEGVMAVGLKGQVLFVNAPARDMLGLKDRELPVELPNPWEEFDLPEAAARCAGDEECIEALVQSGETFLRVNLVHLPEFDGHKGGSLVIIQDLSEGRRLEANQQRFLSNAAHALKTPITTIVGATELLLSGDDENPEVRSRFLEHISAEARRMQQLSDTLLRIARTGWDQRDPELEALDINEMAGEVIEQIEPLAESAGVEVTVEGKGDLVLADREWTERALLILLDNAVKHSEKGGRVRLRLEGHSVAVEDEGSGIDPEDLPYVFERFYQGAGNAEGFGLGLSICKELVERMGGDISISSRQGEGTTVKIELPEKKRADT